MARILVVDDHDGVRATIGAILATGRHEVVEAADGTVDLGGIGPVDAAMVDVFMPGADGLEFLQRVRRERPGMPVVMMTGAPCFHGMDVVTLARRMGAAGVVLKPFDVEQVLSTVKRVLVEAG